jgi:S-adenosyl methyltransferase
LLPVADFDRNKPSIARVYDYWLGGKDNFAADRDLGDQMMSIAPEIPDMVRENRAMLTTAVSWAAAQGISQFIDLGCGLPTEPSTYATAQATAPDAKVAYVDNDSLVISHLTALLHKDPAVAVIDRDVDDSGTVIAGVSKLIDLSRPACLVLAALLHFYTPDAARDLVARYVPALAPGSYVVLTAACVRPGPAADRLVAMYSAGPHPVYIHSAEDLASFAGGLEVVPPGVVDARAWRPGGDTVPDPAPRGVWMNGVMARVPEH